ncbi:hypothetical protein QFC21_001038 [Naganishia friedmannii]|uniref:Uncharacterized protein n=1 Tax=Naganishia friedmannii TaxID=89922 RepID=A0ACC2W8Q0_9TREE|nr:hypothetical protein QFC21_001038 [Naganishia friedmannii]
MAYLFSGLLNWLRGLFFAKHLEVTIVGLQFSEDVVPTVAFNLRQVRKGNVVMKIWDVARASVPTAASELQSLLAVPALAGVPLLVLANKNDLPEAMGVDDLISEMALDKITNRPVSCYSTSNKTKHNLDIVLAWLSQRAH